MDYLTQYSITQVMRDEDSRSSDRHLELNERGRIPVRDWGITIDWNDDKISTPKTRELRQSDSALERGDLARETPNFYKR